MHVATITIRLKQRWNPAVRRGSILRIRSSEVTDVAFGIGDYIEIGQFSS
jgi:hypothetical protein